MFYLSLNHSNQTTPVSTWVYSIFVIYTKDQLIGEPLNTWDLLKKILNEAFVTVISFAFNKSQKWLRLKRVSLNIDLIQVNRYFNKMRRNNLPPPKTNEPWCLRIQGSLEANILRQRIDKKFLSMLTMLTPESSCKKNKENTVEKIKERKGVNDINNFLNAILSYLYRANPQVKVLVFCLGRGCAEDKRACKNPHQPAESCHPKMVND